MPINNLLLLNIILSVIMTGIIWLVQIVIYPSFQHALSADFHKHHVKSIGPIVAPLMTIELIALICLLLQYQDWILISSAACLVVIWISTFFIQVPIHNHIRQNMTISAIKRLILTNWIRTIFWTLKSILLLYYTAS